jgi:hypothetical protein
VLFVVAFSVFRNDDEACQRGVSMRREIFFGVSGWLFCLCFGVCVGFCGCFWLCLRCALGAFLCCLGCVLAHFNVVKSDVSCC